MDKEEKKRRKRSHGETSLRAWACWQLDLSASSRHAPPRLGYLYFFLQNTWTWTRLRCFDCKIIVNNSFYCSTVVWSVILTLISEAFQYRKRWSRKSVMVILENTMVMFMRCPGTQIQFLPATSVSSLPISAVLLSRRGFYSQASI